MQNLTTTDHHINTKILQIYAPLHLNPRSSVWLTIGILIAYILALGFTLELPLPLWIRLWTVTVVSLFTWMELAQHVLYHSPWAVVAAVWDAEGNWELQLASGAVFPARLISDSTVTLPLIILNFYLIPWGLRSLILTADNCDAETLRRLRVRLRLEYRSKSTTSP